MLKQNIGKNILRYLSIILLIFLALNALAGSIYLIIDPSGETIQMPVKMLDGTPFSNYLIPGIILFIANGLMSLVTAFLTIKKTSQYPWFIIFQGSVLIGWLTIELILNQEFFVPALHYPLYAIGILLIIFGFMIKAKNNLIFVARKLESNN